MIEYNHVFLFFAAVPIVTVIIPVGIDPDFYITSYDDNTTRSGL